MSHWNHNLLSIAVLTALLLSNLQHVLASDSGGSQGTNRIIGGSPAPPGEFPFIVRIHEFKGGNQMKEMHCAGSILDTNTIMTAAHCLYSDHPKGNTILRSPKELLVFTNADNGRETVDSIHMHSVSRVIPATDFYYKEVPGRPVGDFGIIKLARPINFAQEKVAPINLVSSGATVSGTVTLAGWGRTGNPPSSPHSQKLLKVDLSSAPDTCAKEKLNGYPDRSYICLVPKTKGARPGDSGGPCITGSGAGRTLVGVISGWVGNNENSLCVRLSRPEYNAWIQKNRRRFFF